MSEVNKIVKNEDGTATFMLDNPFDYRGGLAKTIVLHMPSYQQANLARKLTQHITKAFIESSSTNSTTTTVSNDNDSDDVLKDISESDLVMMQIQKSDIDYAKFCDDVQDILCNGCAKINGEAGVSLQPGYLDNIGYNDYQNIIKEYVYLFLVSPVILKMLVALKK